MQYRRARCPQKVNCGKAAREATLGCPAVFNNRHRFTMAG